MSTLIQIGNSKGVRIPKALIEQAQLEGTEIELELLPQGLLIKPVASKHRQDWELKIQKIQARNATQDDEGLLQQELNHDADLEDWQW